MVQVVSKDSTAPTNAETMALAMERFIYLVTKQDTATHIVLNTLSEIDPMLILDAGNYLMEHGAAYTDFTDEEMDSLTNVEHIRAQVELYDDLLDRPRTEPLRPNGIRSLRYQHKGATRFAFLQRRK